MQYCKFLLTKIFSIDPKIALHMTNEGQGWGCDFQSLGKKLLTTEHKINALTLTLSQLFTIVCLHASTRVGV